MARCFQITVSELLEGLEQQVGQDAPTATGAVARLQWSDSRPSNVGDEADCLEQFLVDLRRERQALDKTLAAIHQEREGQPTHVQGQRTLRKRRQLPRQIIAPAVVLASRPVEQVP